MISVIIPTFNRKELLLKAIDSVFMQKDVEYEIIIVDDCSVDGTQEAIERLRKKEKNITYIRNTENRGPGYARREGFLRSKGNYIVFMDDDDYYTASDFYKKALATFREKANSNLAFVAGNAETYLSEKDKYDKRKLNISGYVDGMEYLLNFSDKYEKPKSTFTAVFDREILEKSGIKEMYTVNDASIYMRVLLMGNAFILNDVIGVYLVHGSNISNSIACSFLIDNFEEKKVIRERLEKRVPKDRIKDWWKKQVKVTFAYYVLGTHPVVTDTWKVYRWIRTNSRGYITFEFKRELVKLLAISIVNMWSGGKRNGKNRKKN